MVIFIKLFQAILYGVIMLFSAMMILVALFFFTGMIAELLGFEPLAEVMFDLQKRTWKKTKKWFFRYKDFDEQRKG